MYTITLLASKNAVVIGLPSYVIQSEVAVNLYTIMSYVSTGNIVPILVNENVPSKLSVINTDADIWEQRLSSGNGTIGSSLSKSGKDSLCSLVTDPQLPVVGVKTDLNVISFSGPQISAPSVYATSPAPISYVSTYV